jgi:hypothetical protein
MAVEICVIECTTSAKMPEARGTRFGCVLCPLPPEFFVGAMVIVVLQAVHDYRYNHYKIIRLENSDIL